jgi:AAA domain (dynein-related subfamily)
MAFNYITYGAKVNADTVTALLDHALDAMLQGDPATRPTPVCIWGLHGIGKTELVRDLARQRGFEFVYIAPAQFEEMGDLTGMPKIAADALKGEVTRLVPPEWAPARPGPGILLLDDVNRADDRILRGIMQLLQYYELVSWSLPPQWLVVLTANPDGGDYSVTTMDDAMLTRMLHVTMEFDAKSWGRWAERADIDERGIHFVLTYPELVNGRRTTPRSLVQFFQALQPIENLRENLALVKLLGDACLDDATTQAFLQFINLNLDRLPAPEEILGTNNFETLAQRLERLVNEGSTLRLDMLSVVVTRLINHLVQRKEDPSEVELENLKNFILLKFLPNDLRLSMARELTQSNRPGLMKLYAIPEIGKLLLDKM